MELGNGINLNILKRELLINKVLEVELNLLLKSIVFYYFFAIF